MAQYIAMRENTTPSADMVPAQTLNQLLPEQCYICHWPSLLWNWGKGTCIWRWLDLYIECYVFHRTLIDRHESLKFTYLKSVHNLLQWHLMDLNRSFFAYPKMKICSSCLCMKHLLYTLPSQNVESSWIMDMDTSFDSIHLLRMTHIYSTSHLKPFTLPFYLCLSSWCTYILHVDNLISNHFPFA